MCQGNLRKAREVEKAKIDESERWTRCPESIPEHFVYVWFVRDTPMEVRQTSMQALGCLRYWFLRFSGGGDGDEPEVDARKASMSLSAGAQRQCG